jgi:hypothetical protein
MEKSSKNKSKFQREISLMKDMMKTRFTYLKD